MKRIPLPAKIILGYCIVATLLLMLVIANGMNALLSTRIVERRTDARGNAGFRNKLG